MSSRAEKRAAARMAKKQEARAEREAQGIYTPSASSLPSPSSSSTSSSSSRSNAATGATVAAKKKPATPAQPTVTTQTSTTTTPITSSSQPLSSPKITDEVAAAMTMERVVREMAMIRNDNVSIVDDISLMEQSVHQLVQNGDLVHPSNTSVDAAAAPGDGGDVDGEHGRKSMREVKLALRKRAERLHYNCMAANEHCMRLFFALDRVTGDASIKTARKDAVQQVQQLSDWMDAQRLRLEALLRVLPCVEVLSPSPAPTLSPSQDDLAALADDLMRDFTSPHTSTSSSTLSAPAEHPVSSSSHQSSETESKPAGGDADVSAASSSTPQMMNESSKSSANQRRTVTIIGIALLAILVAYVLATH